MVAKLNAIAMIKKSGDIPQNVNFAVKSSHAASFLEVHGVQPIVASATATGDKMSGPDVAERLRHASVLIMCFT